MYDNNIFDNLPCFAKSALQIQSKLISAFPTSVISALQAQMELVPRFPTSIISALQVQAELVPQYPAPAISALQSQVNLTSNILNALPESTINCFRSFSSYYDYGQLFTIDLVNQMSVACSSICNAIKLSSTLPGDFDFLKNLNFQEDFVNLTDNDCNSINAILETSDFSDDVPLKVSNGKMAMADFIKSVLIPILAIVLPMLLTIYYHKVDSIESQKQYIEELQLKEKELQLKEEELRLKEEELRIREQQLQNDIAEKEIIEGILIEFQNQSEYYKTLLSDPEYPCVTPELPDEVLEPFVEAPCSSDSIQDSDLSNPDASKSSITATHKER